MDIFFVRHGESFNNVYDKGLEDSANFLTTTGILQAGRASQILSTFLKENEFQIIASKLPRAIQTAYIMASNLLYFNDINTYSWLNEIAWFHNNRYIPKTKIIEKYGEEAYRNLKISPNFTLEHESQRDVYNRVKPGFKQLIRDKKDKQIVIVAHYFVIKALLSYVIYQNETLLYRDNISIDNLSIFRYTDNTISRLN